MSPVTFLADMYSNIERMKGEAVCSNFAQLYSKIIDVGAENFSVTDRSFLFNCYDFKYRKC